MAIDRLLLAGTPWRICCLVTAYNLTVSLRYTCKRFYVNA